MSIPGEPSTLTVVAAAARQAGLPNATITSAAVTAFAVDWLEAVKVQLWQNSTNDKLLDTTAVLLTAIGSRRLGNGLPSDFDHETTLRVFDGSDEFRGAFQAATVGAVQLGTNFSAAASTTMGRYVFTLSGMGRAQYAAIATYDDTTKWATLDTAYTTTPTSTTTYVVEQQWWELAKREAPMGVARNGKPERYRMVATTCEVEPPSDRIYPAILFYGANLTRLDDAGYLFTRHLRERLAYWKQGVKVQVMEQFDDDRYDGQEAKWQAMLANYGAKNKQYTRMSFDR